MANRILPIMLVVLAGVALAETSGSAAPAANDCLAKPKGAPPAGKHWYYQTKRKTQRKCWFLGDEGAKTVKASPKKPTVAAAPPADPHEETRAQPPIADAHAEMIEQPRVEQPPVVPVPQPWPEPAPRALEDTKTHDWALASRWPDTSIAYSPDRAATVNDPAPAPRTENAAPVLAANLVVPVEPSAVTVASSAYLHFGQFAAALIVVVVVGGVIFMSFAARRRDRGNSSSPRVEAQGTMQRNRMPWTRSEPEDIGRVLTIAGPARRARPT